MVVKTVLCYGTLMRGMRLHDWYCGDALTIDPAATTGRLYHLPYGFPAMFDAPNGIVHGEVMTFPNIEKTLERLDRLEGYHPGDDRCHYLRIAKQITLLPDGRTLPAWVYVYPESRLREVHRVGTFIPNGFWREFMMSNVTPV